MKRFNAGEWMLVTLMLLLFLTALGILVRAAWQSPQIRDVPATATPTVRVLVLPTASLTVTTAPMATSTPAPVETLPGPSTRVPATATPMPTMTPTMNVTPPTQRG